MINRTEKAAEMSKAPYFELQGWKRPLQAQQIPDALGKVDALGDNGGSLADHYANVAAGWKRLGFDGDLALVWWIDDKTFGVYSPSDEVAEFVRSHPLPGMTSLPD